MLRWARGVLGVLVAAAAVGGPVAYYRATYAHAKRLRVVTDGTLYRSGQLTADGFRDAVRRFGIKTVVNLQEEARDPRIPERWQSARFTTESTVCRELGVRYVPLDGGVLDDPGREPGGQPKVIDDFYAVMNDRANYPVLIHCKAGLHRTGLIAAVYRMEYEGRTPEQALRELKANGFGTFAATDGNEYLKRFIFAYRPTPRPEGGK